MKADIRYALRQCRYWLGVVDRLTSDAEKETPKEKELPPLASPSLEKENTKEKELLAQTEFERWWKVYPRKVAKKKAYEIFRRIFLKSKPEEAKELVELIIAEIKAQSIKYDWTKDREQYIPHPTTWLSQARFLDAVSKEKVIPFSQTNNTAAVKKPANYLASEGGVDEKAF